MFCFPNSDHVIFSREFAFCLFIMYTCAHGCTCIGWHLRETAVRDINHHVVWNGNKTYKLRRSIITNILLLLLLPKAPPYLFNFSTCRERRSCKTISQSDVLFQGVCSEFFWSSSCVKLWSTCEWENKDKYSDITFTCKWMYLELKTVHHDKI